LVSLPSKNASQSWRFVTLEVRVISHKKEALQPLSVPKNVAWNSLTFRGKIINEPMNGGGDCLWISASALVNSAYRFVADQNA
jgi:hypothetical protein